MTMKEAMYVIQYYGLVIGMVFHSATTGPPDGKAVNWVYIYTMYE